MGLTRVLLILPVTAMYIVPVFSAGAYRHYIRGTIPTVPGKYPRCAHPTADGAIAPFPPCWRQARAKVELREHVTERDAKDVVDMMQEVRVRRAV